MTRWSLPSRGNHQIVQALFCYQVCMDIYENKLEEMQHFYASYWKVGDCCFSNVRKYASIGLQLAEVITIKAAKRKREDPSAAHVPLRQLPAALSMKGEGKVNRYWAAARGISGVPIFHRPHGQLVLCSQCIYLMQIKRLRPAWSERGCERSDSGGQSRRAKRLGF